MTVTAQGSPVAGDYSLFVDQLAQRHQVAMTFDPTAAIATDGELSLTVDGHEMALDLSTLPAGATVSELAQAINSHADNPGVSATLMRSGTQTFLVLTSAESGAASAISTSFTPGADPAAADITAAIAGSQTLSVAQDAMVRIGSASSVTITSASNELDDVIDGVTITLNAAQAATDAPVTLSVGQDNTTSADNVNAFVDEFNALVSQLKSDKLAGDSMAGSLQRQLRTAFQGTFEGQTLYSVGLEFDRYGKLSVDNSRFEAALQADPDGFNAMLSGENGVMNKLQGLLEPYSSSFGLITDKTRTLQSSLDLVTDRQERHELRMENVYKRYLSQFTQMQVTIAQLESSMGSF